MLPFEFLACAAVGGGCVLVEVDTTVRELAEGSLLLDLGSLGGILCRERLISFMMFNSESCAYGQSAGKTVGNAEEGKGSGDTHIFVCHDCGGLTGVRFPRCVEKRKVLAIVDVLQISKSWIFACGLRFCWLSH